jgi:hypothetical protein
LLNKFDAEAAFFNIALFPDNPDIIRAGRNAIFATNAVIFINQNHSIFPLIGSSRGTDLYARRIVTMLALDRKKFTSIIRECPIFTLFEMVIGFLFPETILVLARHSAGMASYAFCFINHHPISRHSSQLYTIYFRFKLKTTNP